MAAAAAYPFTTFNFSVEINRGQDGGALVAAAFSDCDGLDMSMEVKTIREGGSNNRQIRLNGPATYANLVLKRGMTANFDLWKWFSDSIVDPGLRADAEVVMLGEDGQAERARFRLARCVPIKMKAPALSAKDGAVAVEELHIAYESLVLIPGKG